MIAPNESVAGHSLKITSLEALDAAIARVVSLKVDYTAARAKADKEIAAVEKRHTDTLTFITDAIADVEADVREYCDAHRDELFVDKKSRSNALADFGFENTPPRVETASRKIKWADVVTRLLKLSWGKVYLKISSVTPDKNALLADREKLTPEQLTAAGIQFCQDEQFFIRPKLETAADSKS